MPFRIRHESRTDAEWIRREGERARRKGRPLYLAHEQREGWSAPLPLYLWWCPECGVFTVSHPQGLGRIMCRRNPREHRVRLQTWRRFRVHHAPPIFSAFLLFLLTLPFLVWFLRAC